MLDTVSDIGGAELVTVAEYKSGLKNTLVNSCSDLSYNAPVTCTHVERMHLSFDIWTSGVRSQQSRYKHGHQISGDNQLAAVDCGTSAELFSWC